MGMVTDVFWTCPGCGSRERAQVRGEYDDPSEFPMHAVPADRGGLRWNPPCSKCGEFRLEMPEVFVVCGPVRVDRSEL